MFELVFNTGKMDEGLAKITMKQLMRPFIKMHDSGWAHRDIKLENLVLDMAGLFRVADFGYAC